MLQVVHPVTLIALTVGPGVDAFALFATVFHCAFECAPVEKLHTAFTANDTGYRVRRETTTVHRVGRSNLGLHDGHSRRARDGSRRLSVDRRRERRLLMLSDQIRRHVIQAGPARAIAHLLLPLKAAAAKLATQNVAQRTVTKRDDIAYARRLPRHARAGPRNAQFLCVRNGRDQAARVQVEP